MGRVIVALVLLITIVVFGVLVVNDFKSAVSARQSVLEEIK
jgi:hypothetical protein